MTYFDEDLLDEFVDFFEWIYAVEIPQESRDELYGYVSRYWDDEDTSEHELFDSATEQYSQVVQDLSTAESSRALLHKHFRREFRAAIARGENDEPETDRDNILRYLAQAIEKEDPDAIDRLPSVGSRAPATRQVDVDEAVTRAVTQLRSYQQQAAAPVPQPPARPAPTPQPTSGYGSSPMIPQTQEDMQQRLLEEQRQAQLATMLSNISAMRHSTMMATIQNFRA